MSKLENDCISMLKYANDQRGRWVSMNELTEKCNIPPSTARNILMVSKNGIFIKKTEDGSTVHQDVFEKIASKYHYDYKIIKKKNENGRMTWYLSAVQTPYNIN